ncbi:hypothetical protein BATDEDRAFT_85235 [Batrachochytrium dendrobatidis JAM81]|uniref:Large ribosomal subunit protein bL34m n=1 Tax=Batrachochytrium dendrobatidis (strain JAM81 / FGSC 10211) TaxID=684364 RepID=F4NUW0_BATDJ|nr:uncharacterized protein BATDEDRAFT_85235 [Batrachochytrium dendrobatidis JAM81]EGF84454.1 hypothetical protein BATDEDRAFT_85235 [Batrachochytrium dendrobatidis JAM81]KAJ8327431.1 hypothetical protein O5D80_004817 [Batrachochytrium dendrobatidis]KAK5665182.1 hypothetical protein QVD99_008029 [Batrachochytrium dendrobatidis]|eukprot:XP_006676446.1 hypothetical protein BATDEDRAFT_85235 [Batrachochytrium dendrobatidis JAM81]
MLRLAVSHMGRLSTRPIVEPTLIRALNRQFSSFTLLKPQGISRSPVVGSRSTTAMSRVSVSQSIAVRYATYGQEYNPSTLVRKRRFGFLKRLKTLGGRKILFRRMLKGRRRLTH